MSSLINNILVEERVIKVGPGAGKYLIYTQHEASSVQKNIYIDCVFFLS